MSFTKYQKVESSAPLSKKEHDDVEDELRKVGKSSMSSLSDNERKRITHSLDSHR